MTTTYFRIQSPDRDTADLLTPGQISHYWGRDDMTQDGVSVCDSLEELAAYLAGPGQGIPYGSGGWVIVELEGDYLDAGHDDGESLIQPTRVVSVTTANDDFFELIAANFGEDL